MWTWTGSEVSRSEAQSAQTRTRRHLLAHRRSRLTPRQRISPHRSGRSWAYTCRKSGTAQAAVLDPKRTPEKCSSKSSVRFCVSPYGGLRYLAIRGQRKEETGRIMPTRFRYFFRAVQFVTRFFLYQRSRHFALFSVGSDLYARLSCANRWLTRYDETGL